MLELITANAVTILAVIGALAFIVSLITEVTKGLPGISKIPTDLQVIILSILLCIATYFAYCSYVNMSIEWYYIVAVFIGAFIVAFVAMYGWDKLSQLWNRFQVTGSDKK
jgi:high-affinity Fe2+/Pb2+ permease